MDSCRSTDNGSDYNHNAITAQGTRWWDTKWRRIVGADPCKRPLSELQAASLGVDLDSLLTG